MIDSTPQRPRPPDLPRTAEVIRRLAQDALSGSSRAIAGQIAQSVNFDRLTKQMYEQTDLAPYMRQLSKELTRTYSAPNVSRLLADAIKPLSADAFAGIADSLSRTYSRDILREINLSLQHVTDGVLGSARSAGWEEATRAFEQEMEASGDPAEDEEGRQPSVGWWLATRPALIQLRIVAAGLAVIDAYARWVAEVTGEEGSGAVQDPVVQKTLVMVIAVVSFLILYFDEKSKDQ